MATDYSSKVRELLKAEGIGIETRSGISRRKPEDSNCLSFAQERLLFLDQLNPASNLYNVPIGMRLTGRLDIDVFNRSLGSIFRRHEILRTCYSVQDGKPVMHTSPEADAGVELHDLSRIRSEARGKAARRLGKVG